MSSPTQERWWQGSGSKAEQRERAPYLPRLDAIQALEADLGKLTEQELTARARDLALRARAEAR